MTDEERAELCKKSDKDMEEYLAGMEAKAKNNPTNPRNITDEKAVQNNAKLIVDKFGQIDGLVNNAAKNPKVEVELDEEYNRLLVTLIFQIRNTNTNTEVSFYLDRIR